jgi:SAM-dependent methyltransferase
LTFDPELHDELIERYFAGVAPLLAEGYHPSSRSGYVYVRRREVVRAWLGELGGGALLDVGCGTGAMCEVAHAAGCSYLGIDISGEMIAEARLANAFGCFQIGRVEHLPAADASVDVVLALGVLEYVHPAELPLALAEIARVLRPDGHLVTSLLSRTSPLLAARAARDVVRRASARISHRPFDPGAPEQLFTLRRVGVLLSAAGLTIERHVGYGFVFVPERVYQRHPDSWAARGRRLERLGDTPLAATAMARLVLATPRPGPARADVTPTRACPSDATA